MIVVAVSAQNFIDSQHLLMSSIICSPPLIIQRETSKERDPEFDSDYWKTFRIIVNFSSYSALDIMFSYLLLLANETNKLGNNKNETLVKVSTLYRNAKNDVNFLRNLTIRAKEIMDYGQGANKFKVCNNLLDKPQDSIPITIYKISRQDPTLAFQILCYCIHYDEGSITLNHKKTKIRSLTGELEIKISSFQPIPKIYIMKKILQLFQNNLTKDNAQKIFNNYSDPHIGHIHAAKFTNYNMELSNTFDNLVLETALVNQAKSYSDKGASYLAQKFPKLIFRSRNYVEVFEGTYISNRSWNVLTVEIGKQEFILWQISLSYQQNHSKSEEIQKAHLEVKTSFQKFIESMKEIYEKGPVTKKKKEKLQSEFKKIEDLAYSNF